MSKERDRQAEIEALRKRVDDFWNKCYAKLHAAHVQNAGTLRRIFLNDNEDDPGKSSHTPSPK
jgi:hypothetical protein